MLPPPPELGPVLATDKWTDAELFRIVKHGVRFTGMPAWPTQDRDDEVWAMVAFLRELPGLDEAEYRALAFGPSEELALADFASDFEAVLADCARCHGEDGLGRGEAVPVIAGQRAAYLDASLQAYARATRHSGVMQLAATEADAQLFRDLADHFAELPAAGLDREAASPADHLSERGRDIAENGIEERDIPSCQSCHGRPDRNPVYPTLDGQKRHYLRMQLELFVHEKRGGSPLHDLMQEFAHHLEPEEIEAVAAYYSTLPPMGAAEEARSAE